MAGGWKLHHSCVWHLDCDDLKAGSAGTPGGLGFPKHGGCVSRRSISQASIPREPNLSGLL